MKISASSLSLTFSQKTLNASCCCKITIPQLIRSTIHSAESTLVRICLIVQVVMTFFYLKWSNVMLIVFFDYEGIVNYTLVPLRHYCQSGVCHSSGHRWCFCVRVGPNLFIPSPHSPSPIYPTHQIWHQQTFAHFQNLNHP